MAELHFFAKPFTDQERLIFQHLYYGIVPSSLRYDDTRKDDIDSEDTRDESAIEG